MDARQGHCRISSADWVLSLRNSNAQQRSVSANDTLHICLPRLCTRLTWHARGFHMACSAVGFLKCLWANAVGRCSHATVVVAHQGMCMRPWPVTTRAYRSSTFVTSHRHLLPVALRCCYVEPPNMCSTPYPSWQSGNKAVCRCQHGRISVGVCMSLEYQCE